MATARMSREEKKAQTRQRVLEAAHTVFAHRGLAAASLDEIAEEAGLTKGAIYSNFESKEELVGAVLNEVGRRRIHDITADVDASRPLDEEARRTGALFMATAQEELPILLLALELTAYSGRNPQFRDRQVGRHRESLQEIAEEMEARAPDFGVEPPLPARQMAVVLNALGIGLSIEKVLDPTGVPDDLFGKAIALMYRGGEAGAQRSGTAPS